MVELWASWASGLGEVQRIHVMQALLSAARSANSPAVRRSLAQAVAAVAKTASEARTAKLIADAAQLYSDPGGTHASTT